MDELIMYEVIPRISLAGIPFSSSAQSLNAAGYVEDKN
jgi:hypothetical protein